MPKYRERQIVALGDKRMTITDVDAIFGTVSHYGICARDEASGNYYHGWIPTSLVDDSARLIYTSHPNDRASLNWNGAPFEEKL